MLLKFLRMVLTRESLQVHKMAMRVLKLVTTAAQEKLSADKREKLRGMNNSPLQNLFDENPE